MPIYEYKCKVCGAKLEKIQGIKDEPLTDCTECGTANGLHRLISTTSFILRGSGWYATDYRNRSKSPSSQQDPACKSPSKGPGK